MLPTHPEVTPGDGKVVVLDEEVFVGVVVCGWEAGCPGALAELAGRPDDGGPHGFGRGDVFSVPLCGLLFGAFVCIPGAPK